MIEEIPDTIGQCKMLSTLLLDSICITELPATITELQRCVWINHPSSHHIYMYFHFLFTQSQRKNKTFKLFHLILHKTLKQIYCVAEEDSQSALNRTLYNIPYGIRIFRVPMKIKSQSSNCSEQLLL